MWYLLHLFNLSNCLLRTTSVLKFVLGLFSKKRCPKGSRCNFLHVFRNPGNEFYKADRDIFEDKSTHRSIR